MMYNPVRQPRPVSGIDLMLKSAEKESGPMVMLVS